MPLLKMFNIFSISQNWIGISPDRKNNCPDWISISPYCNSFSLDAICISLIGLVFLHIELVFLQNG